MRKLKVDYLTAKQVAEYLHVSLRTIRRYTVAGLFPKPYQRLPKALWWVSDIERFVAHKKAHETLMQSIYQALENPKAMSSRSRKWNMPLIEKAVAGYLKALTDINVKVTINAKR